MLLKNPFSSAEQEDLPDRLTVLIDGMHLPMDALMAQAANLRKPVRAADESEDIEIGKASTAGPEASANAALIQSCQPNGVLTPELLRALDIVDPVVDGELRWNVDSTHQELQMGMRFAVREVQSFSMEMVLGGIDSEALANKQLSTPPQLVSVELGWHLDPAVGQRFVSVCAAQLQQPPEDFRDRLAGRFAADLEAKGFILGPGMQIAVRQFYREWGDVRLGARPDEPVGVLSLAFVPPAQLARRLGAQLEINDQIYTDLDFNFVQPSEAGIQSPGGMLSGGALGALLGGGTTLPKTEPPDTDGIYPEPARIDYRYYWQRVPLTRLGNHLDRTARVHLHDGLVREGKLTRVDDGLIVVEQRLHGGKFTVPVPRQDVAQVEVRLREAIAPQTGAGSGSGQNPGPGSALQ
jgi:hypothetical protein